MNIRVVSILLYVKPILADEDDEFIVPIEFISADGNWTLTYVQPVDDFDWSGIYGWSCTNLVGNLYVSENGQLSDKSKVYREDTENKKGDETD